ncbi:aldehyde dehydrogenase family protein [Roseovarius sp. M141]|uniref:aldehyde dehydrogenase family protein n=1 Tax=Roseovarius sp. M141 TaxID=2583806 RepID=UPI0020CE9FE0|nr:aldehyde dehydrogenase family protein [Roseovarius sp. M141]
MWRRTSLSQALDCVDPSTGEAFDTIANGDARDVDGAVNAARAALLRQIAAAILENREELAALETRDNGKPLAAVPQENL